MIGQLLPAEVLSEAVVGDDASAYLLPEEEALVGQAVERRRREFTVARTCARRALGRLGLPETPILRGREREPLWPDGVVGSITHCAGYCAAAVARDREVLTLGIDAEIHAELSSGVLDQVAGAGERDGLAGLPAGQLHWDRLLFSAKESVYKAWFPVTRRWLGFEDALVRFDPDASTFEARLLVEPPTVEGRILRSFAGRFVVRDGFVLTAVVVAR